MKLNPDTDTMAATYVQRDISNLPEWCIALRYCLCPLCRVNSFSPREIGEHGFCLV